MDNPSISSIYLTIYRKLVDRNRIKKIDALYNLPTGWIVDWEFQEDGEIVLVDQATIDKMSEEFGDTPLSELPDSYMEVYTQCFDSVIVPDYKRIQRLMNRQLTEDLKSGLGFKQLM